MCVTHLQAVVSGPVVSSRLMPIPAVTVTASYQVSLRYCVKPRDGGFSLEAVLRWEMSLMSDLGLDTQLLSLYIMVKEAESSPGSF